jgi:Targeting protein for Xklp2 (TPX2) domain
MKIPSKRPIPAASTVLQQRKKSKTEAASADVSVPKPTAVLKSRLPVTKKHPKPISSDNRGKPTLSRVNGPVIERPPVFKPEAPDLDDTSKDMGIATSVSSFRCATSASMTGRLKNSHEKDAEPVNSITLNDKGKTVASSSHGSSRVVGVILSKLSSLTDRFLFFFLIKFI